MARSSCSNPPSSNSRSRYRWSLQIPACYRFELHFLVANISNETVLAQMPKWFRYLEEGRLPRGSAVIVSIYTHIANSLADRTLELVRCSCDSFLKISIIPNDSSTLRVIVELNLLLVDPCSSARCATYIQTSLRDRIPSISRLSRVP